MGNFKGTENHDLVDLVGKKIKSIHLQEVDINGDGTNIRQFYRISCSGDQEFVLALDSGTPERQYASASLMDPEDLDLLLEEHSQDYNPEEDPFNEDEIEDSFEDFEAFDEPEDEF